MTRKSTQKEAIGSDLAAFQDFKKHWEDGTLTEEHRVVAAITKWAKTIAYRFNYPELADDLRDYALLSLARGNYVGQSTLDTYIARIVLKVNDDELRKRGGKPYVELHEGEIDMEEYLRVAAQIRQELGGRSHSNSTELIAEERQR